MAPASRSERERERAKRTPTREDGEVLQLSDVELARLQRFIVRIAHILLVISDKSNESVAAALRDGEASKSRDE